MAHYKFIHQIDQLVDQFNEMVAAGFAEIVAGDDGHQYLKINDATVFAIEEVGLRRVD